jgi:hypothetical protein
MKVKKTAVLREKGKEQKFPLQIECNQGNGLCFVLMDCVGGWELCGKYTVVKNDTKNDHKSKK